jgi:hypothetical protein
MKLYKITATNSDGDTGTTWASSQTESAKARKEFMEKGFKRNQLVTEDVEVPTSKDGLLNWLNKNCK